MGAPRKPRQAREGARNQVHKIVQPVETITVNPDAWSAAVGIVDREDGDRRRIRIVSASTVIVLNQPQLAA